MATDIPRWWYLLMMVPLPNCTSFWRHLSLASTVRVASWGSIPAVTVLVQVLESYSVQKVLLLYAVQQLQGVQNPPGSPSHVSNPTPASSPLLPNGLTSAYVNSQTSESTPRSASKTHHYNLTHACEGRAIHVSNLTYV